MCYIRTEGQDNNNDVLCCKPRQAYTYPCYSDALISEKFIGKTFHDEIIEFVNQSYSSFCFFSIKHKGVYLMACNIYIALQLVYLENFNCIHKEVNIKVDFT